MKILISALGLNLIYSAYLTLLAARRKKEIEEVYAMLRQYVLPPEATRPVTQDQPTEAILPPRFRMQEHNGV